MPGPRLTTPSGAPVLNGPFSARVEEGPPLAPGVLALGFVEAPTVLPAFGGAVLYPKLPFLSLPFALGADGARDLVVAVDTEGPSGALVLPGDGAGGFAALKNLAFTAFSGLATVVLEDANEDGKRDLIGASGGSTPAAFVIPGDGAGGFGTPAKLHPGAGKTVMDVAVADLDADGLRDLVTANYTALDVSVFPGAGGGTFGAPQAFPAGIIAIEVRSADLDGDGLLDLAALTWLQNYVSVLRASAPGAFLAPLITFTGSVAPRSLSIADVDLDGVLDCATANWWSKDVTVLLGQGDGTFLTPLVAPLGELPWALELADLDADGVPDAAVADKNLGLIYVLLGNGDGAFSFGPVLPAGEYPSALAVRDLDGDGRPELLATGEWQGLTLFRGLGGGSFADGESHVVGGLAAELATGDLDGDGLHDVAVALGSSNDAAILINTVGEQS